jgi:nitronate monooxygenase
MWPDRRLLDLLHIEYPIIQAPMAGAMDWELVAAAAEAGALGSLPCAMLTPEQVREQVGKIRARTHKPFNLGFFCHTPPPSDGVAEAAWRRRLAPYYKELGLDPDTLTNAPNRTPFDPAMCDVVAAARPAVVSFHFGLPAPVLIKRVKEAGCRVLSSATTVGEARWLEDHGADAIIAQGYEAGGHRGMFLTENVHSQVGGFALVPQVAGAVNVPVIAAGGIADGRGIAAAFALGASGVQIGTAYLFSPEAKISAPHRAALKSAHDDATMLTNVLTGRPARGVVNLAIRELGPISDAAPPFPLAANALAPLRAKAEAQGSGDFSPMWSGQAAALGRELGARELTQKLAAEALDCLRRLAPPR